jgi:hypothetical protein
MKFVRLPLTALALISLAACTTDATGPDARSNEAESKVQHGLAPGKPLYNGQMFGSSGRSDTTVVVTVSSIPMDSTEVVLIPN